MEEDLLFESKPRSYRMDRKSAEASELRDAVNGKLFDFLGNYTDEVLSEYIVVLVCNGKNQNQARDDLEAFLGEDSGRFVAWLWDHLTKENYILRAPTDTSSIKAEETSSHEDVLNEEQKSSSLADLHTHLARTSDIPLPKDGRYDSSDSRANSKHTKAVEIQDSMQRWCPSTNGSLTEENNERLRSHLNEVNPGRSQAESMVANEHFGAAYKTSGAKRSSSRVRCSPGISSDNDQLHNEDQHQKIAKIDSRAILHQPLPVLSTGQPARSLRSIVTEDQQSMPLYTIRRQSAVVESTPRHVVRPRGNVWDRLGKPCDEDAADQRGKSNLHNNNFIERDLSDSQGELQNPGSMWIKQNARLSSNLIGESVGTDYSSYNTVFEGHTNEGRKLENSSNNIVDQSHVNNSKRRRMYSECGAGNSPSSLSGRKGNCLEVKEIPPKTPIKYNKLQSMDKVASEAKGSATLLLESTCDSVIPARSQQNSQADKIDSVISPEPNKRAQLTNQSQKLVPKNSQLPSKSKSPSKAESLSANHSPVKDELLDLKLKVREMETSVHKLRKQAGVQNHSEEDVESRTVLVTNVHYGAQREVLLSHFTRCGPVAKVVMLTDTITAQPKGAAYIVFANKDSVDRAVSMSGTSFYSRILTVMKKADMPPDFLVPSQSPAKLMQSFSSPPFRKGSGQYSTRHLQWRRENSAKRENSVSANAKGVEPSAAGV